MFSGSTVKARVNIARSLDRCTIKHSANQARLDVAENTFIWSQHHETNQIYVSWQKTGLNFKLSCTEEISADATKATFI